MADKLPVNYKDDIINTEVQQKRKYNLINNSDGTISLEDVTEYSQKGSTFDAREVNAITTTVNSIIDEKATLESDMESIKNGTLAVGKATNSENANSCVGNAATSTKLASPVNINGVAFDGSADINILDSTKVSKNEDFILVTNHSLVFSSSTRKCRIEDSRVTANSLADVYFTADTISVAADSTITVETVVGAVELTAINIPTSTVVATIRVRVVE